MFGLSFSLPSQTGKHQAQGVLPEFAMRRPGWEEPLEPVPLGIRETAGI